MTDSISRLREPAGESVNYGCGCVASVSWDRSACHHIGHEPQSSENAADDHDVLAWHELRSTLGMTARESINDVKQRVRELVDAASAVPPRDEEVEKVLDEALEAAEAEALMRLDPSNGNHGTAVDRSEAARTALLALISRRTQPVSDRELTEEQRELFRKYEAVKSGAASVGTTQAGVLIPYAEHQRLLADSERLDWLEGLIGRPLQEIEGPRADGNGTIGLQLRTFIRRVRGKENWPEPWTLREAIDAIHSGRSASDE